MTPTDGADRRTAGPPYAWQPLRFMAPAQRRSAMHQFIARWFPVTGDLLDVACGSGELVAAAGERGLRALGIDRNAENLAPARARGLRVVVGDVLRPPVDPRQSFDVITMEHVIEHFQPHEAAQLITIYARHLRPNGRLIIVTPNSRDWAVLSEIFWLDPTHARPYPARLLEAMLTDLDLRVVHSSTQRLVKLGSRAAMTRPIGQLRFGREYQRMNQVVVAERAGLAPSRTAGQSTRVADIAERVRRRCGYRLPRLGPRAFRAVVSRLPSPHVTELQPGLRVPIDPTQDVEAATWWQGTRYESPTASVLLDWLDDADRFFDIGANYGWYSFLAVPHPAAEGGRVRTERDPGSTDGAG